MAAEDLCTVAAVKAHLGIVAATDEALLQSWVTGVSGWIKDFISQPIVSTAHSEPRDGPGGARLRLRYGPVIAVTAVYVGDELIPEALGLTDDGWVLDDAGCVALRGYTFTRGVQNVLIDYTAGYAAVPASIERAAVEMVAWRYKEKDRIGQSSKGVGGETVSFSVEEAPKDVLVMLNQYRRVVPA